tara:strand:+ start:562 stop:1509 length:948 start_codon:yes stop_codon:yes gene_type:complete
LKLQTQIPLKTSSNPIDYQSEVLLVGSCFVENIGSKLEYYKYKNQLNPFGILFHPKAIERFFELVVSEKVFNEDDLIFQNERWHCFDAHSDLSSSNKDQLIENLNQALRDTKASLEKVSHVVITLGTAWGYRFKESGSLVANCHKIPQREFEKELYEPEQILTSLQHTIEQIKKVNKNATIILTVSPVRHLKDGFVENQRSKAHLITAVQQLVETEQQAEYFPSYEIMMDELRDYRFYDRDMVHPNTLAVDYIWKRLIEVYTSDNTQKIMAEVETIQKGISHRPFNEHSQAHQKFRENLELKKKSLRDKIPHITF